MVGRSSCGSSTRRRTDDASCSTRRSPRCLAEVDLREPFDPSRGRPRGVHLAEGHLSAATRRAYRLDVAGFRMVHDGEPTRTFFRATNETATRMKDQLNKLEHLLLNSGTPPFSRNRPDLGTVASRRHAGSIWPSTGPKPASSSRESPSNPHGRGSRPLERVCPHDPRAPRAV
jgi:hypothetical protein